MSKNLRINNKQFVDETRKLSFVFNGKKLYGYKGDTLASAYFQIISILWGEVLSTIDQEE